MNGQLAKKSAEKEEKIFSAFEEIPFIIIRAQLMRKRFPEEGHLKTRCIKLYETLLGAIADLIGFLLPEKECELDVPLTHRLGVSLEAIQLIPSQRRKYRSSLTKGPRRHILTKL